jgi:hypothetical protein
MPRPLRGRPRVSLDCADHRFLSASPIPVRNKAWIKRMSLIPLVLRRPEPSLARLRRAILAAAAVREEFLNVPVPFLDLLPIASMMMKNLLKAVPVSGQPLAPHGRLPAAAMRIEKSKALKMRTGTVKRPNRLSGSCRINDFRVKTAVGSLPYATARRERGRLHFIADDLFKRGDMRCCNVSEPRPRFGWEFAPWS